MNWQRIGLQVGGLALGAYVYNMGRTQINELITKVTPAGGDPKIGGLIQIALGGGIVALGDFLASMPKIARTGAGTMVPAAALAMAAVLVNDGIQQLGLPGMSGSRHMRGTIVRSPMIASQVMRGTRRLGPGMRGSLETWGAPQPSPSADAGLPPYLWIAPAVPSADAGLLRGGSVSDRLTPTLF